MLVPLYNYMIKGRKKKKLLNRFGRTNEKNNITLIANAFRRSALGLLSYNLATSIKLN